MPSPTSGVRTTRLRENHSGMETLQLYGYMALIIMLRENHSGMETFLLNLFKQLVVYRCVRTIVVWKLAPNGRFTSLILVLRENHSGMETG